MGVPCGLAGYLGMLCASYNPRHDVRHERWPEDTFSPFSLVTAHVLWKIGMGVPCVAMLATLVEDRRHRTRFWPVFILLQPQTQIGSAFVRSRTLRGTRLDWTKIPALRSDRWGER